MHQTLSQHFLNDPSVIKAIVTAGDLAPTDLALEIGPGHGILTHALLKRVQHLTAVELDQKLARNLGKSLTGRANITIHQADFLKVDLTTLFPPTLPPIKVFGNLPYAITSPIFEKLLAWPQWDMGVFLVQLEVAERMESAAGSRAFGILSLAVQVFAEAEIIQKVGPESFLPPPRVMSAVIRLRRHAVPRVADGDREAFFDLAHAAFAHRRKTLLNSLVLETHRDKKIVEEWLCAQGINPGLRAESLGVEDYARLAGPWAIFRREINLT